MIATHDGNQQLRLLYGTRNVCQSARVGDYAEADGEKQHEFLFDAHELTIRAPVASPQRPIETYSMPPSSACRL